jgi:hypothetical protein
MACREVTIGLLYRAGSVGPADSSIKMCVSSLAWAFGVWAENQVSN